MCVFVRYPSFVFCRVLLFICDCVFGVSVCLFLFGVACLFDCFVGCFCLSIAVCCCAPFRLFVLKFDLFFAYVLRCLGCLGLLVVCLLCFVACLL